MTSDERVAAVVELGFTERQVRFLVTVMLHAGVCVPRQYATFAGTAYGRRVTAFFRMLVKRGFASAWACRHPRARIYHVRHFALYRAVGAPHSRFRRPVPVTRIAERLTRLDAMLSDRDVRWLATTEEKDEFVAKAAPQLAPERLPHVTIGTGPNRGLRWFPGDVSVGIEPNGRAVLLVLATASLEEFRLLLQRYGDLLSDLPRWALRVVVPSGVRTASEYDTVVREELCSPLAEGLRANLRDDFAKRREDHEAGHVWADETRQVTSRRRFSGPRFRVLYRRWLVDGDAALDVAFSHAIAEAVALRDGRLDVQVHPVSYNHLSPLVVPSAGRRRKPGTRAEEGDEARTRHQPLSTRRSPGSRRTDAVVSRTGIS